MPVSIHQKKYNLLLIIAVVSVLIYWTIVQLIDPYTTALGGAVFEILWLPTMVCTFAIPFVAFIFWAKNGYKLFSWQLLLGIVWCVLLIYTLFFN